MVAAKGDQVPPGVGPGQFHGGRVGRGSVLGELDLVGSFDDPSTAWAHSTSIGLGRVKFVPSSSWRRTASRTAG